MSIHLWRTERLARDLAADRVSEQSAAHYMMVGAALYVQANYSALWFGAYRDWAFFFELALVLVISVIGVNECYKANGGAEGTQFITRLCALAVPIGLKLAVLGIVLGQGFYYASPHLLGNAAFRDPALVYRYVSFLMPVAFTFIYYWRIAHHINAIRAHSVASPQGAL
jgi:hypothetical protein